MYDVAYHTNRTSDLRFGNISMNQLLELFEKATTTTYATGSIICQLNAEKVENAYCIKYGYVKVYTISDDGDEHIMIILRRNEIFPIFHLTHDDNQKNKQRMFFEALGKVKLLEISKDALTYKIHSGLGICDTMLAHIGERFLAKSMHLENLSYKGAYQRLVYCLLFFAQRFGHFNGGTVLLDPVFTHKIIGNSINLTRGTVTREFEVLRKKKLLTNKNRQICILNIDKLSQEISEPFNLGMWDKLRPQL